MNEQDNKRERDGESAAAEFLQEKSIHALRQTARALGVEKVPTHKKAELIPLVLQKVSENNAAAQREIDAETAADLQTLQKILNIR